MIPRRDDVASMVRLAIPVAAVQVGIIFMGVVDTVMVGRVSPEDLAAVALGNLYFFACAVFGMGALFTLDPVVSQAHGAGDEEAIRRGIQRGWVLAGALTLLAAALLLPAQPVMAALRQPEDVIPIAAAYALVSIPGLLPFYGFVVLRQSLQAMGIVRPIVVVILAANLVNVGLNWILIFGNLGMPAMGAVGSSWATTLARWFMMLGLLVASWSLVGRFHLPLRREALDLEPLVRMLKVGAPIGIQFLLEFGIFGVIGILMGVLGTIEMAAHQVAISLASLTFMAAVGVTQASTVLVGQAVGAENPEAARRAAGAGLILAVVFMGFMAALFLTIPKPLARLYTDQVGVFEMAVLLIPIAGFFQIFDGLQTVASGVLRGIGDTTGPMIVNALGFWLVGLPISYLLGLRAGLGAEGLWWGLVAGLAAVAVFLLVRIYVRLGRELKRLTIDEQATRELA